ncbi:iron complex outermembrane receptor protein [Azomonas agilis]|uniref:Iron complex outermembrane receptor protein n=1 Tax=Azomonas agilis TaxID=116849 RepID=A0A562IZS5_9GAMM|nr:TonB-dependent receptor [Azomonas agilis]TWH76529.1 iron complex outermembrane receptor protein [Azomonas agilis]
MNTRRHPLSLAVALSLFSLEPVAQTLDLEATVISSNPLDKQSQEMTTAAGVLEGDALIKRREATLGETLQSLPGVQSSSFGAGVGRPVIRGQSGARVKILSDGVDVLDASNVSPDHAVTTEPSLARRIEVLKGPTTLLYGGGAIGGVVNVLDEKVPTYIPERGYEGTLELRGNTVANEGTGVFGLTTGAGNFALRLEGVKRQADDYEISGSPSKEEGSFNDTHSFTLGTSFIGDRGYLGVAYTRQDNRYGLLAHQHADCHQSGMNWACGEEDEDEHGHEDEHDHEEEEEGHDHDHSGGLPLVDLEQKRWDLRGELSDPLPGFERARVRVGYTNYQHKEIEGGTVATRFDSDAVDSRLELTHKPLFGWKGVVGLQHMRRDFQVEGEEAYMPKTVTRNHALFILEEYTRGDWRYEFGLRREWQSINAEETRDTSHQGNSWSVGTVWNFAPEYALGLSYARSQRLPTAEELYSKGPHAATRTIELGNVDLDEETSRNLELSLRKFEGSTTFSFSLYRNAVDDYINPTDTRGDIGNGYRQMEYRQEDAVFTGMEGEIRFQVLETAGLTLFGDRVRARLRNGGGDLPRISPARLGARWEQRFGSAWDGELEFYRVNHQHRTADYERETSGYNMLSAGLSYTGYWGLDSQYMVYLRGNNLLDEKWRNHVSYIKDDVVMPGRNLTLGMRLSF